jgi:lipid-binding SYLF domain-containing protein
MGVAFFILYGTLYSLGVFMSQQKPNLWSSIISIFVAIVAIGFMRGITKD